MGLFLGDGSALVKLVDLLCVGMPVVNELVVFYLGLIFLSNVRLDYYGSAKFVDVVLLGGSFSETFTVVAKTIRELITTALANFPVASFAGTIVVYACV